MAGHVMMMLGPIRFSVSAAAYEELQRKAEYRWPLLERLGRRPAHQFIGIGADTISLKGTIYPSYDRGGRMIGIYRVEEMRSVAEGGIPLNLVTGYGQSWGRFVIKSVEETESVFFDNGSFRKQEFNMELSKYGEDSSGLDGIVFSGGLFQVPRLQVNPSVASIGLSVRGSFGVGAGQFSGGVSINAGGGG